MQQVQKPRKLRHLMREAMCLGGCGSSGGDGYTGTAFRQSQRPMSTQSGLPPGPRTKAAAYPRQSMPSFPAQAYAAGTHPNNTMRGRDIPSAAQVPVAAEMATLGQGDLGGGRHTRNNRPLSGPSTAKTSVDNTNRRNTFAAPARSVSPKIIGSEIATGVDPVSHTAQPWVGAHLAPPIASSRNGTGGNVATTARGNAQPSGRRHSISDVVSDPMTGGGGPAVKSSQTTASHSAMSKGPHNPLNLNHRPSQGHNAKLQSDSSKYQSSQLGGNKHTMDYMQSRMHAQTPTANLVPLAPTRSPPDGRVDPTSTGSRDGKASHQGLRAGHADNRFGPPPNQLRSGHDAVQTGASSGLGQSHQQPRPNVLV